jgi:hypothetical protein
VIDDTWKGTYSYEDGRALVSFELRLCKELSRIRGNVSEPASGGVGNLGARIEGLVANETLTFRKTYDGRGGFSHSVEYESTAANGRMRDTWRIGDEASGLQARKKTRAAWSSPRCCFRRFKQLF